MTSTAPNVHGNKGVYCGGDWINIEDCDEWQRGGACGGEECKECPAAAEQTASGLPAASGKPGGRALPPRPCATRFTSAKPDGSYDVIVVGAGCIGGAICRELSR